MANFNWADYVILAIFLVSTLSGFSRGLVREIIALLALAAAFVLATLFSHELAAAITHSAAAKGAVSGSAPASATVVDTVSYAAIGLSYILIFVGTLIAGAIIGFIINLMLSTSVLGIGNRILGAMFGLCRGFILALVLIFVVQLTALSAQQWWQDSVLIKAYQPAVSWLAALVSPNLADLKKKTMESYEKLKVEMQKASSQPKNAEGDEQKIEIPAPPPAQNGAQ
jgi:membrane protein required for colicin V production